MASIDFDPQDYLDEVDTDDLIEELENRSECGNKKAKAYMQETCNKKEMHIPADLAPRKLKEMICDYLQISHCTQVDDVLITLKHFIK